jgi:hypothetical protein
MNLNRALLGILYTLTIIAVIVLIITGGSYWAQGLTQRPYHPLHATLKPGGYIGHGVGILGTIMMLLLLLYSLRKRVRFMHNLGNIRDWLNYHIWLGITGPLLVIFHTAFKLGGIVAVSFWSMIGVALSGVVGRYIYIQIPRTRSGTELTSRELSDLDQDLLRRLRDEYHLDAPTLMLIQAASGTSKEAGGWAGLIAWIGADLSLPLRMRSIRQRMQQNRDLHSTQVAAAMKLARQRIKLHRRMSFLAHTQDLLHHWHIIHRPFALVMFIIMTVHVVIAVVFGYRWIFSPSHTPLP